MASTGSALVALLGLSLAPPPLADGSPPSVGTLVVELDRLHGRRDDPATEKALEARLAEALAAAPASPDVLWRAARFEIWRGDGTRDATRQRAHGERAAALARKAATLAPGRVEGHYFAAIGVGLYAQAVGVWKTVHEGRDKEFTRALDQALKLDPFYDRGGPLVMKGRYHYEMPWPMRDLDRSAEHLRRALAKFPHNRRARIFLAETLLKDGEPAQAKQALDPVFTPRPEEDPPEDRRARKLAEAVAAKIAKELR